ncbi:MAG TPA: fasciclin domain-containing protein [Brevundimonas sp.]|nr:fasciclin domain-containing protein [Brevundimonas sp.]
MKLIQTRTALMAALAISALAAAGCTSMAGMDAGSDTQATVMVGGAPMYPTKTIVENAVSSRDHTTLVAAVTAAGLVPTLSGPGPFTVFAPTNAAFAKLPAGAVESLVQPANKAILTKILTYHVVPGRVSAADLIGRIRAGGGRASLTTVEGGTLTASLRGDAVILTDEKGGVATVIQADVFQSNGVIHVTDTVSMPN